MTATDRFTNRSFTDCVNFTLMRELRVRDTFTTDLHFQQTGLIPLLKP